MKRPSTTCRPLLVLLLILPVLGFGCTKVGPDYQRQELETDSQYEDTVPEQLDPEKIIRPDWWNSFQDPELDRYVQEALKGSNDLQILLNRIRVAGAMIDESEAALYPSVDFGASGRIEDSAERGTSESYRTGAELNWELDLWGKNRRQVEAEQAEQKAAKADYRAGYLKLVADVATAYFTIRQYDQLRRVADDYITYQDLIRVIYEQQFKEGIVGQDKLLRQRAILNETKQDSLEMRRGRKIQEHRLAALIGRPPGQVTVSPSKQKAIRPLEVPVGLPSELLQRRPDIVAAEYRLVKATQKIGIAEAARLPSISLTMEGGLTSTSLATILSGGFLAFLPKITLPIFDAGKSKAAVEKATYEVEIARNKWAKTANNAFQEVADSLTNLYNRKKQLALLQAQVDDLQRVKNQLKAKLELGLISQLELNDVIMTLYDAQKNAIKMETLLMNDTVLLYKALGGGWPAETVN